MSRSRFGQVALWLCLAGAALLTVLRTIDPTSLIGIRLVSFTPFAILALLVALGLGGLVLRGRLRLGVVLVCVALLGPQLWWQAPLLLGDRPEAGSSSPSVRVMTVNARLSDADPERIAELVRNRAVDLLVIEEIDQGFLERLEAAGLSDRLPHQAGRPERPPYGTMIFSRGPLSNPLQVTKQFDSWLVTAETQAGELRFLGAHPVAPIASAHAWWRAQADLRVGAREADVVAGDFNATLDHLPLRRLRADGFRSAADLTNAGLRFTWPAEGIVRVGPVPVPSMVQIDHVLVREPWTVTQMWYVEVTGSDHRAVIADVVREPPR